MLYLNKHIVISLELDIKKPNPRTFYYAIEQMGAPCISYGPTNMVRDFIYSDIKGALNMHLAPILYPPAAQESPMTSVWMGFASYRHIAELLSALGITNDATT